jgi:hypothetical protein
MAFSFDHDDLQSSGLSRSVLLVCSGLEQKGSTKVSPPCGSNLASNSGRRLSVCNFGTKSVCDPCVQIANLFGAFRKCEYLEYFGIGSDHSEPGIHQHYTSRGWSTMHLFSLRRRQSGAKARRVGQNRPRRKNRHQATNHESLSRQSTRNPLVCALSPGHAKTFFVRPQATIRDISGHFGTSRSLTSTELTSVR